MTAGGRRRLEGRRHLESTSWPDRHQDAQQVYRRQCRLESAAARAAAERKPAAWCSSPLRDPVAPSWLASRSNRPTGQHTARSDISFPVSTTHSKQMNLLDPYKIRAIHTEIKIIEPNTMKQRQKLKSEQIRIQ